MKSAISKKSSSGFTLVELLIVIAVIGVLAAVILAVLNPLQQFARGRDTGRLSTINQVGNGVQRLFTTSGSYLAVPGSGNGTFITDLKNAGELQSTVTITNPNYSGGITSGCTGVYLEDGYCYNTDGTSAVVYARAESDANASLCSGTQVAWITWSSAAGRAGIVCTVDSSTPPAVGVTTFAN